MCVFSVEAWAEEFGKELYDMAKTMTKVKEIKDVSIFFLDTRARRRAVCQQSVEIVLFTFCLLLFYYLFIFFFFFHPFNAEIPTIQCRGGRQR